MPRIAARAFAGDCERPTRLPKPSLTATVRIQGSFSLAWSQHARSPATNPTGTPNVPARAAFRWVSFQVSPFTRTSVMKPVYV